MHLLTNVSAGAHGVASLTNVGNAHFSAQRHNFARSCYELALSEDPHFLTAVLNLGLVHLVQNEIQEAEMRVLQALDISPQYAYAHMSLGNVHASKKPPATGPALTAYQSAYTLEPSLSGIGSSLGEAAIRHAETLTSAGDISNAELVLRKVTHVASPMHYSAAVERLITLLRDTGQPSAALGAARTGLQYQPGNVRVMLGQAMTHRTMGHLDKALAVLRRAANIDPKEPEVLANYGLAMSHSGRNSEAIHIYKKVIKVRPDFVEAYVTLGEACANIHDYTCAIKAYKDALRV